MQRSQLDPILNALGVAAQNRGVLSEWIINETFRWIERADDLSFNLSEPEIPQITETPEALQNVRNFLKGRSLLGRGAR